jgi:hypothetical protein
MGLSCDVLCAPQREIDLGARRPLRLLYECANHDDPARQGASNMFEFEFPTGTGAGRICPRNYDRVLDL